MPSQHINQTLIYFHVKGAEYGMLYELEQVWTLEKIVLI